MLLAWGRPTLFLHTTKGFTNRGSIGVVGGYFVQTRTEKGDIMGSLSLSKTAGVILALFAAMAMVSSAQTIQSIESFNGTNGEAPLWESMVQGANGNFYGTTEAGGANNGGTVFEITPAGKLTTLHSFDGTDGKTPIGGLIQGSNGNFYGTTQEGGADNSGTVLPSPLLGS
jgi:uncharacterized repeat protein (TIGR03803 family)